MFKVETTQTTKWLSGKNRTANQTIVSKYSLLGITFMTRTTNFKQQGDWKSIPAEEIGHTSIGGFR